MLFENPNPIRAPRPHQNLSQNQRQHLNLNQSLILNSHPYLIPSLILIHCLTPRHPALHRNLHPSTVAEPPPKSPIPQSLRRKCRVCPKERPAAVL